MLSTALQAEEWEQTWGKVITAHSWEILAHPIPATMAIYCITKSTHHINHDKSLGGGESPPRHTYLWVCKFSVTKSFLHVQSLYFIIMYMHMMPTVQRCTCPQCFASSSYVLLCKSTVVWWLTHGRNPTLTAKCSGVRMLKLTSEGSAPASNKAHIDWYLLPWIEQCSAVSPSLSCEFICHIRTSETCNSNTIVHDSINPAWILFYFTCLPAISIALILHSIWIHE